MTNTGADKSALRHLRKLMERPEMTKKARIKKLPVCSTKNHNNINRNFKTRNSLEIEKFQINACLLAMKQDTDLIIQNKKFTKQMTVWHIEINLQKFTIFKLKS